MGDTPPYHLDIDGVEDSSQPARQSLRGRPWIGIHFDCCGVYSRIYRNAEGTAYKGWCPQCMRRIRLCVGQGGTDARFFTAQ